MLTGIRLYNQILSAVEAGHWLGKVLVLIVNLLLMILGVLGYKGQGSIRTRINGATSNTKDLRVIDLEGL